MLLYSSVVKYNQFNKQRLLIISFIIIQYTGVDLKKIWNYYSICGWICKDMWHLMWCIWLTLLLEICNGRLCLMSRLWARPAVPNLVPADYAFQNFSIFLKFVLAILRAASTNSWDFHTSEEKFCHESFSNAYPPPGFLSSSCIFLHTITGQL
jgi:hypothetical protein